MKNNSYHQPVLLKEVIKNLSIKKGGKYIDATLGLGGHTCEIIKNGGLVLGIEWDPEVLAMTKERLTRKIESTYPDASFSHRDNKKSSNRPTSSRFVLSNFARIDEIARENRFYPVDGILFDLGISRWHYKFSKRGFAFDDQTLDMRINPDLPETALNIVNSYSYDQLYRILAETVQEELAGPIARALVSSRRLGGITTAQELSNLAAKVYREHRLAKKANPATKLFLALRSLVNEEIENLKLGLAGAMQVLAPGGKLLVITFNSNEDRLVKKFSKLEKQKGQVEKLSLIFPDREEIKNNRLCRSAKLRVLVKKSET
ncbi:MAG: 16S rRNA (cytosine(1402)-N(4))-methyltransferase RsmH [Patescibacteria group bacterium]